MCILNPHYASDPNAIKSWCKGCLKNHLAPGTGKYLAKKVRHLATWTYCLAFRLIKISDKLDPPPAIEPIPRNVREILKNNLKTLDSPSCKLH